VAQSYCIIGPASHQSHIVNLISGTHFSAAMMSVDVMGFQGARQVESYQTLMSCDGLELDDRRIRSVNMPDLEADPFTISKTAKFVGLNFSR
jgi:hypothetical protein